MVSVSPVAFNMAVHTYSPESEEVAEVRVSVTVPSALDVLYTHVPMKHSGGELQLK